MWSWLSTKISNSSLRTKYKSTEPELMAMSIATKDNKLPVYTKTVNWAIFQAKEWLPIQLLLIFLSVINSPDTVAAVIYKNQLHLRKKALS